MIHNQPLPYSHFLPADRIGYKAAAEAHRFQTCSASPRRTRLFGPLKHLNKTQNSCWQPNVRYLKPVSRRPPRGGESTAGRTASDKRKAALVYAEHGNGPFITTSTTKSR